MFFYQHFIGGIMKKLFFLILVSFLIQPLAHAKKQKPSPGGTDGCGLGWRVTKKKTLYATSVRGMTNLVVPPTFGMSTGTIGCEKHKFAAKDVPAVNYVATNFNNLKHEIAMGQGPALIGLSELMGCSNAQGFSQTLKSNFNEIFSHGEVFTAQVFKNIKKATLSECRI